MDQFEERLNEFEGCGNDRSTQKSTPNDSVSTCVLYDQHDKNECKQMGDNGYDWGKRRSGPDKNKDKYRKKSFDTRSNRSTYFNSMNKINRKQRIKLTRENTKEFSDHEKKEKLGNYLSVVQENNRTSGFHFNKGNIKNEEGLLKHEKGKHEKEKGKEAFILNYTKHYKTFNSFSKNEKFQHNQNNINTNENVRLTKKVLEGMNKRNEEEEKENMQEEDTENFLLFVKKKIGKNKELKKNNIKKNKELIYYRTTESSMENYPNDGNHNHNIPEKENLRIVKEESNSEYSEESTKVFVNKKNKVFLNMCDNPCDIWYGLKTKNGKNISIPSTSKMKKKKKNRKHKKINNKMNKKVKNIENYFINKNGKYKKWKNNWHYMKKQVNDDSASVNTIQTIHVDGNHKYDEINSFSDTHANLYTRKDFKNYHNKKYAYGNDTKNEQPIGKKNKKQETWSSKNNNICGNGIYPNQKKMARLNYFDTRFAFNNVGNMKGYEGKKHSKEEGAITTTTTTNNNNNNNNTIQNTTINETNHYNIVLNNNDNDENNKMNNNDYKMLCKNDSTAMILHDKITIQKNNKMNADKLKTQRSAGIYGNNKNFTYDVNGNKIQKYMRNVTVNMYSHNNNNNNNNNAFIKGKSLVNSSNNNHGNNNYYRHYSSLFGDVSPIVNGKFKKQSISCAKDPSKNTNEMVVDTLHNVKEECSNVENRKWSLEDLIEGVNEQCNNDSAEQKTELIEGQDKKKIQEERVIDHKEEKVDQGMEENRTVESKNQINVNINKEGTQEYSTVSVNSKFSNERKSLMNSLFNENHNENKFFKMKRSENNVNYSDKRDKRTIMEYGGSTGNDQTQIRNSNRTNFKSSYYNHHKFDLNIEEEGGEKERNKKWNKSFKNHSLKNPRERVQAILASRRGVTKRGGFQK